MPVYTVILIVAVGFLGVSDGHAQTVLWSEDFDDITPPAGPAGWTLEGGWQTSTSAASSGSGLNNLMHAGSTAASARAPALDLTEATVATLSFLARRSGSYDRQNLRVTASTDGGASFPTTILGTGAALPAAASKYEAVSVTLPPALLGRSDVILQFEGLGGSSSSSNVRIDDVLVETNGSGDLSGGTLGFSTSSGQALPGAEGIGVPVRVDFIAPPGLQGLQFRVGWTLESLALVGVVPGEAVADEDVWTLSHEAGAASAEVVLVGEGVSSLPSGTYDSLLTLQFASGSVEAEVLDVLTLSNVVGALATPEGTDAGIQLGAASYHLTVGHGAAFFDASPSTLDMGVVDVGESDSAFVTVRNTGGATSLAVTAVTSSNSLFTAAPGTGMIAPDDSMRFVITFAPVDTAFGHQTADVRFHHSGADSVAIITITGKGRGGRGDAEGDGTVDVLDVIHTLDFVLARISPGPAQKAAADLFPFPDGDDELDVRDLTVLLQAVARGRWPDGVSLPVEGAPAARSSTGAVQVALLSDGPAGYLLELRHDVPIRAFQLVLPAASASASVGRPSADLTLHSGYDATNQELRIVGFVPDGGIVESGVERIAVSSRVGAPRYATVVGEDGHRIAVDAQIPTLTDREELPARQLGAPYPNPFQASEGSLRIDGVPAGAEMDIFDVLGRRIHSVVVEGRDFEWNGRDGAGGRVSPGLYITRMRLDGRVERTWAVVVLR